MQRPAHERIREVARELFYRQGIRAVGVEAIVAAAGATKMSLYRHFASKDELVAACLADRTAAFWAWFDSMLARHPDEPRAQLLALFAGLAKRATGKGFRGCPMTNAAIEFPEPDHPGRHVAETSKRELRARLETLARGAGAAEPAMLADGLLLLFEGSYASSQTFGPDGPAGRVDRIAASLIDAWCGRPQDAGAEAAAAQRRSKRTRSSSS
jgi:AcrR family transcriptional regulator